MITPSMIPMITPNQQNGGHKALYIAKNLKDDNWAGGKKGRR